MRVFFTLLCCLLAADIRAQDSVKISGTISNCTQDSVEITYNDNFLAYYPKNFYAVPDKKGCFRLSFPVAAQGYTLAELHYKGHIADLILQPGDSLVTDVDEHRFDSTLHYKGKGAAIQNFVAQRTLALGRMNQYSSRVRFAINKEPSEFLSNLNIELKKEESFFDAHKSHLPASFAGYWKAYFRYYNYFFTEQYPLTHEMIKLRRYTDTIPEASYAVVKQLPYAFSDSFLQLPPYLLYLTGVFDIKLKAAGFAPPMKDTAGQTALEDSVFELAYKLLPDKSGEFLVAQNIYGRAKIQPLERTEAQMDRFRKRWPNSRYLDLVEQQVHVAERLAPGQPAPDFAIETADGRKIQLSDLKGKVVYVSFWANFCRQCVGEMVNEHKVKDLLKNKPVEFVHVSIDNDSASDNALLQKYKVTGLSTHVEGGWQSKEALLYGVQNLPAYFLIDKDGKIAVQRPYSPMQSTELLIQIGKLLK